MTAYLLPARTLRSLLFLMGVISPRAFALGPATLVATEGACPAVVVQIEGGPRCKEGEAGCFDDENGLKALATIKQGCAEGRGGSGAPCLYGIFIRKDGKATAVCGPRLLSTKR